MDTYPKKIEPKKRGVQDSAMGRFGSSRVLVRVQMTDCTPTVRVMSLMTHTHYAGRTTVWVAARFCDPPWVVLCESLDFLIFL